jgi:tetratricopeptide (TPR) repeat protein
LVAEKLPLLLLISASAFITYRAQAEQGAVMELEAFPPAARLANAMTSYAAYLVKSVWPLGLAAYYPHPGAAVRIPETIAALALLSAISLAAVFLRNRAPYLAVGWMWYLGTLVPVIGLVQVGLQAYADRYTYFPQIGILLAICWGTADLARSRPRAALALAAAAAVILAALTSAQIGVWHDSLTLWEHALSVTGDNSTGLTNLAETLERQGKLPKAVDAYRAARDLAPNSIQARINLGNALKNLGKTDEAVQEFEAISKMSPQSIEGCTNLGNLYFEQHKLSEAAEQFEEACRRASQFSDVYLNRARVEVERGNFTLAADYYTRALDLQPDSAPAHAGLGVALLGQERNGEALEHLRAAVTCDPGFVKGHILLGKTLAAREDFEGAAWHFEKATQLQPELSEAWYGLGVIRARRGQLAEAGECLATALERDPRSRAARDALLPILSQLRRSGRLDLANQIEIRVIRLMPARPGAGPPPGQP